MRAIGGDVMDFNPASWPCQPLLDHKSVVVLGIVEKDVDQFLRGIHKRDGHQECDRAHSINRQHFDHTGLTRFQINGSMNVQGLPPAGRTSCVGCTASAKTTDSSSPRLLSKFS